MAPKTANIFTSLERSFLLHDLLDCETLKAPGRLPSGIMKSNGNMHTSLNIPNLKTPLKHQHMNWPNFYSNINSYLHLSGGFINLNYSKIHSHHLNSAPLKFFNRHTDLANTFDDKNCYVDMKNGEFEIYSYQPSIKERHIGQMIVMEKRCS